MAAGLALLITIVAWQTLDWWELDDPNSPGPRNLVVARVLLVPSLFGLLYALPDLWRRSTRLHRGLFAAWSAYLGLFLVATWPGLIMSDTNDMVYNSQFGRVYEWFSYLHSLVNLMVFELVPNVWAFGVLQVAGTAAVLTYATSLTLRFRHGRAGAIALNLLAALSAPVVVLTVLYSRDTIFSLLHVLLALLLADWVVLRRRVTPGRLVGLAGLSGFLSAYRGDGIVLLLVVPAVLVLLRPTRRQLWQGAAVFAGFGLLFNVVLPKAFVTSPEIDRNYGLSLRINPLGAVLQSEWYSPDREADLAALRRVIDVEKTIETSESFDLVPFWAGYWNRQATEADFAAFNEVADRLLVDNLEPVLSNRLQTFLAASGMGPYQFTGANSQFAELSGPEGGYGPVDRRYDWTGADPDGRTGTPPSVGLYDAVDGLFAATARWQGSISTGSALHWNVLPALVVLVAALLLWRRAPVAALIAVILLSRVPLLFVAAPAAQFKYYYAMHLGGILVLGILLAHAPWDRLRARITGVAAPAPAARRR